MPDPFSAYGGDWELARGLSILSRKKLSGFATGEQRSPSTGGGIEFADYREYVSGDDVRLLDWTVYLRSRRLVVKLCAEEKELTLVAIVDVSRSMDFGTPNKLLFAKRVASILACISLRGGNRAGVVALGPNLLESQERSEAEACLRQFAASYKNKCVAVLISDLLFPEWKGALDALSSSGCEAHVLHLLAPEELEPRDRGEVTLVDSEDGTETPLHIDEGLLARYSEALDSFTARVSGECSRRGLGFVRLRSDAKLAKVFHGDLVEAGVLC
jgi:uncharacterized protein (DUF58 family)